jgi:uncharacterized ion transporter superfamily protein YfcC
MDRSAATERSSLQIGKRAFIQAVVILLLLMIVAGVLTRAVPAGTYERVEEAGRERVVPGSYSPTDATPPPVWRWFTAPVEVLWGADALTINSIIILLVLISGAFHILETGGVLKAILNGVVARFRSRRYLLMALVIFFFMFAAAVLGIYEGMVPMVVMVVPLAHILGWDSLTGLGMSLLAMAFGFSAAVTNPFTIGVAQKIAGLPLFSGAWLRILFFIAVYAAVFLFVRAHARKVERDPTASPVYEEDLQIKELYTADEAAAGADSDQEERMRRAAFWVAGWIGLAIAFVLITSRIEGFAFLSFPAMGLLFFIAGVGGGLVGGMSRSEVARTFGKGTLSILPAILLILMAMSVKHIIASGGIMDTILHRAGGMIRGTDPFLAALLIYLLTMLLNFFVASASAKAFLMMPILAPLADIVGITRQTAVLAFDFGDGFSNMLYPSNALLLIALGFTVVSYPRWVRWTLPIQGAVTVLIVAFLLIAVRIGFGPF